MITEFLSKPHIITVGGSDDYGPETGSRPATLSAVEPAGVAVEVNDIPNLKGKHKFLSIKVNKVYFKVFRNSFSETIPIYFSRLKSDFFLQRIAMKFSTLTDFGSKFVEM